MQIQALDSKLLLKRTTSRCPVCLAPCPAEVWRLPGQPPTVVLDRSCSTHGRASTCISSDARFYWLANHLPVSTGASPCDCETSNRETARCAADLSPAGTLGTNARRPRTGFDELCTCIALIEIVNSCNLSCPACFVNSPSPPNQIDAVPLPDLQHRIEALLQRKGKIEVLQLSGGEPTLHPELFELLAWLQADPRIAYILLNTNGIRLAQDSDFAARLKSLFPCRRLQIYLQFDGLQSDGQHLLRGADLRALRYHALENCAAVNLPVTLAMTVTSENLPHVWQTIQFGLQSPSIHGIVFQPLFSSGRVPGLPQTRVTTADIILSAIQQSNGRLRRADFTPLPCGDPNCCVVAYLLRLNGHTRSIGDFLNFTRAKDFLRDKLHYTLQDLARCSCESPPLASVLKGANLKGSMTFRLVIKPFMDAGSWDENRIESCCTHVIRPDGKLDSFCRYYSGFPDTRSAP